MVQTKGISKKEEIYFTVIFNFAYAETPEEAFEELSRRIRELTELPISIELEMNEDTFSSIKNDQVKIKAILHGLYDGKRLSNISAIHHFIVCYFLIFSAVAELQDNGLNADQPHYFHDDSLPHTAILSLCLISLLKSGVERIVSHIYKCELCNKYFFSKKIDEKIKFCPGYCRTKSKMTTEERRVYDQNRKSILKIRKESKARKEKIKSIMERRGCTWKEAEEYVKSDEEISTVE